MKRDVDIRCDIYPGTPAYIQWMHDGKRRHGHHDRRAYIQWMHDGKRRHGHYDRRARGGMQAMLFLHGTIPWIQGTKPAEACLTLDGRSVGA